MPMSTAGLCGLKSLRRRWLAVLGVAAVSLALAASTAAGDITAPLYAKMEQRFTTASPGSRTGWSFDGALKPVPGGQQVPPQRGATFVFPPGTRIDLGAVPSCPASDEQLAGEGLDACPARSRVGSGEGDLFLGTAGILTAKAYVFVARPKLALVFTTESGSVLRVLRGTVRGNRVRAIIPRIELPGGYEVAVTRLALKLRRAGTRERPAMRTPARCPRSGRWTFTYLPRYDEPYGVQRSTSSVRCRRG